MLSNGERCSNSAFQLELNLTQSGKLNKSCNDLFSRNFNSYVFRVFWVGSQNEMPLHFTPHSCRSANKDSVILLQCSNLADETVNFTEQVSGKKTFLCFIKLYKSTKSYFIHYQIKPKMIHCISINTY